MYPCLYAVFKHVHLKTVFCVHSIYACRLTNIITQNTIFLVVNAATINIALSLVNPYHTVDTSY